MARLSGRCVRRTILVVVILASLGLLALTTHLHGRGGVVNRQDDGHHVRALAGAGGLRRGAATKRKPMLVNRDDRPGRPRRRKKEADNSRFYKDQHVAEVVAEAVSNKKLHKEEARLARARASATTTTTTTTTAAAAAAAASTTTTTKTTKTTETTTSLISTTIRPTSSTTMKVATTRTPDTSGGGGGGGGGDAGAAAPRSDLGGDSGVVAAGPLSTFIRQGGTFPVVLLAKDRPALLSQTLKSLLQVRGVRREAIFVSLHGHNRQVMNVIGSFKVRSFQNDNPGPLHGPPWQVGARRIAEHYKFSLNRIFDEIDGAAGGGAAASAAGGGAAAGGGLEWKNAPAVVVAEDDLLFAPDFMDYFLATAPALDVDPTLWCISAWNDNGFHGLARDPLSLRRTDFLPGLGWLLTRRMWKEELAPIWPREHWDHFLRSPKRHKGRDCLFPEVPRTFHNGIKGTFMDRATHNKYFAQINLNDGTHGGWHNWLGAMGHSGDSSKGDSSSTSTSTSTSRSSNNAAGDGEDDHSGGAAAPQAPHLPARVAAGTRSAYAARLKGLVDGGKLVSGPDECAGAGTFDEPLATVSTRPALVLCYQLNIASENAGNAFKPLAAFLGIWHEPRRTAFRGIHEIYDRGQRLILVNADATANNAGDPGLHVGDRCAAPEAPKLQPYQFGNRQPLARPPKAPPKASVKFQPVAGSRPGQSCDEVCGEKGAHCTQDPGAVAGLNTCDALRRAFPSCGNGGGEGKCQQSDGPDQPAFVPARSECLTSGGAYPFKCQARHAETVRLCPCVNNGVDLYQ